jgi:hypothetical protein
MKRIPTWGIFGVGCALAEKANTRSNALNSTRNFGLGIADFELPELGTKN